MSTPILHVTHTEDLGAVAGVLARDAIFSTAGDAGSCRIGLSGGSTPGPLFDWLTEHLREELFAQCKITWVDERCLPREAQGAPDDAWSTYHADSNARLAADRWLSRAAGAPALVLPMCPRGVLGEDLERFSDGFEAHFGSGLDLALLGAGPDGHIASLFPDHHGLEAKGAVLAVSDSPKPPPERISLTMGVLADARTIVLMAKGGNKAEVLARAYAGDEQLPLGRLVQAHGARMHWVLDVAAAAALV